MVADVGRSTGERASRGDVETPRYQVVSLQPNATQARNLGVLIALATLLFGFLGALAFGVAGVFVVPALGYLFWLTQRPGWTAKDTHRPR